MKKTLTSLALFLAVSLVTVAQTKKSDDETNCYLKWAQKFEDRGADDVADGTYEDVIITFRNGSGAECYNGKCEVKEGKVKLMFIKMEDGSFEQVKKKMRYDFPVTITNGMSKTVLTLEDELINVLWVKKIKPKKAGFVKAAEPTDD
ncbi:MAG: hypothetical protein M3R27_02160 [Bacteroidota bacterium]|nr:hypothetical protein [Bacteroidota bacterium]